MIPAIQAGVAGARAAQRTVDAAARNVANATTREYKKERVVLAEGPGGGVSARAEAVPSPGPRVPDPASPGGTVELSNVDLAAEMTGMLLGQRSFEANLTSIRAGDEVLGTLLDLEG